MTLRYPPRGIETRISRQGKWTSVPITRIPSVVEAPKPSKGFQARAIIAEQADHARGSLGGHRPPLQMARDTTKRLPQVSQACLLLPPQAWSR